MTDTRRVLNLSSFLGICRQEWANQSKATGWFLAIFSAAEEGEGKQIVDDISVPNKSQLLQIVVGMVQAVSGFYEQERPTRVYKVLNLVSDLLQLWEDCRDFSFVLAKVSYLNSLALFHLRFKNYSFAIESFSLIHDIHSSKPVDCVNQVFLSALSNYLCFLVRVGKKAAGKRAEVEQAFGDLFFQFLDRFTQKDRQIGIEDAPILTLLSGIYNQHEHLLSRFEKQINVMVSNLYLINSKGKKKLSENMIEVLVKERVRKGIIFKLGINQDEMIFYSGAKFRTSQDSSKKQQQKKQELAKIEQMIKQNNEVLQQLKLSQNRMALLYQQQREQMELSQQLPSIVSRKRTLEKHSTIGSAVQSIDFSKQSIDLSRQTIDAGEARPKVTRLTTKRKELIKQPTIRKQKWGVVPKVIKFKIHSIFIDVFEDGILFSDYTNENKKYIEWNTVRLIIQRLQGHFVFEEILKSGLQSYFDFIKLLTPYLTKNDQRQICLLSRPLPLIEVNFRIKVYQQEGRYLKLGLMNQYNPERYQGAVDLFLNHYSQFFKQPSQNEYLLYLNDRISRSGPKDLPDSNAIFRLEFIKQKKESTAVELGNLIPVEVIEAIVREKVGIYKCIFLLRNNIKLLVRLIDNFQNGDSLEQAIITVKIQTLDRFQNQMLFSTADQQMKKSRTLQIPLITLTHYFPLFNLSPRQYTNLYSRMVVDCLHNEDGYQYDPVFGGLTFAIKVYSSKTEMIEYGKYFSVVSAELVGSGQRVWALVIRFYDLAYMRYATTVLMNPHEGFLLQAVSGSEEERAQIMRNLLIGESVRTTYMWLKDRQKTNCRLNMFEYLVEAELI